LTERNKTPEGKKARITGPPLTGEDIGEEARGTAPPLVGRKVLSVYQGPVVRSLDKVIHRIKVIHCIEFV